MGFGQLVEYSQVFLLLLVRVYAILRIAPLLSTETTPGIVRAGLSFFTAVAVLPGVIEAGYPIPAEGLNYALLLAGEAMVGIITGFALQIIYASFQVAGQFFSLQMGFGASEVFDPLAQVEIPVMGQFLNLIAMFTFVSVSGFQKIFLHGVQNSIIQVRAVDFVLGREYILRTMFSGLGRIFEQALVISFPILGTLLLVSITMGLLAKAAPQMNLLMLGFPVAISVAFVVILLIAPILIQTFSKIIDGSFETVTRIFAAARGGGQ